MKKYLKVIVIAGLIIGLAGCSSSMEDVKNVPTQNSPAVLKDDVTIIATDFKFDQSEYRVKKGDNVKFTLKNESGQHGFMVPELDISMTEVGTQTFKLDKPGTYQIMCNIPCGSGHLSMKSTLVVE